MTQTPDQSTAALWARFRFSVVGSLLSSPPARSAQGGHRRPGGQDLDPSGERTRGPFRRRDHRAVVLHGAACQGRSRGRLATRRPQGLRQGHAGDGVGRAFAEAVPRPPALELPVALRQSGRAGEGRPGAGAAAFLCDRPAVHAGRRLGAQAAAPGQGPTRRSVRGPEAARTGRSAATKPSTWGRSGISISTTARSRCSPPAARGSARWPWAFSTITRACAAISNSISPKRPCVSSSPHAIVTSARSRYARWDLRRVDLVDPRSGTVLAPLYPLDRKANADGQRLLFEPDRVGVPANDGPRPDQGSPAKELPPLLKHLLAEYSATGLPPAYLPKNPSSHPGETP